MMGTFGVTLWLNMASSAPQAHSHSEILHIVIITIICAIYTLYVVFVLIWLHLSSIVINSVSRSTYGVSL